MLLWLILALLTTLALAAVLWPFLRPRGAVESKQAFDAAVFKDQLEEITHDAERGIISEDEAEAARTEVSRRLINIAHRDGSKRRLSAGGDGDDFPAWALIIAFLCVPVTSSALYLVYGSPGLPDQPLAARLQPKLDDQKIESLVARVEARLREFPGDGRGWEVIAPVYMRLERYADAANAYENSLRINGSTAQRLAAYGNATVIANDGVVSEPAREALQKALKLDDTLVRPRFWLAVSHEQDGDTAKAALAWRKLLQRSKENDPWRPLVMERLAAAEKQLGTSAPVAGREVEPKPGLAGPSREQVEAARDMSSDDRNAMIRGMVTGLSERLRQDGGTVEEWQRLVRSFMVLGDKNEAVKALTDARKAFAGNSEALAALDAAAKSLGL